MDDLGSNWFEITADRMIKVMRLASIDASNGNHRADFDVCSTNESFMQFYATKYILQNKY